METVMLIATNTKTSESTVMLRKVVVIFPLLFNSFIIAIAVAGLLAMQMVPIIWLNSEKDLAFRHRRSVAENRERGRKTCEGDRARKEGGKKATEP